MMRSNVDLPQPEAPTDGVELSGFDIDKLTSSSTSVLPRPPANTLDQIADLYGFGHRSASVQTTETGRGGAARSELILDQADACR